MQTYAGASLAAEVIVPAIDMFNKIASDRMQIELFFADQLVPTGELFQAMPQVNHVDRSKVHAGINVYDKIELFIEEQLNTTVFA